LAAQSRPLSAIVMVVPLPPPTFVHCNFGTAWLWLVRGATAQRRPWWCTVPWTTWVPS
jgi:hypothetical protein